MFSNLDMSFSTIASTSGYFRHHVGGYMNHLQRTLVFLIHGMNSSQRKVDVIAFSTLAFNLFMQLRQGLLVRFSHPFLIAHLGTSVFEDFLLVQEFCCMYGNMCIRCGSIGLEWDMELAYFMFSTYFKIDS